MSDNLPARQADAFGPHAIPLSQAPTAALAFALGVAVTRPQSANLHAPFCAMVEELMRRPDDLGFGSEWEGLMRLLPPEVGRAITMLYQAQRGQRWAATGRRAGPVQQ